MSSGEVLSVGTDMLWFDHLRPCHLQDRDLIHEVGMKELLLRETSNDADSDANDWRGYIIPGLGKMSEKSA
jgi:hypothetical protein